VTMDGISVVENYRAQLAKILRDTSYPELVDRLRERTAHGSAPPLVVSAPPTTGPSPAPVALSVASVTEISDTLRRGPDAAVRRDAPEVTMTATLADAPLPAVRVPAAPPTPPLFPTYAAVAAPAPTVARAQVPTETARPTETTRPTETARPIETARPMVPPPATKTPSAVVASVPASQARPVAVPSKVLQYWVQVGAFKDVEAATQLVGRLLGAHRSVAIVPGASLTRVRVGPFLDRAEAVSTLQRLILRGFRPFIQTD